MKLIFLSICALFLIEIHTVESQCKCMSNNGLGRYCGGKLNSGSSSNRCTYAAIYQCGGYNTSAQLLGPCSQGCCNSWDYEPNDWCITSWMPCNKNVAANIEKN